MTEIQNPKQTQDVENRTYHFFAVKDVERSGLTGYPYVCP